MGEELDDIDIQELRLLEEDLEAKGKIVREKKVRFLSWLLGKVCYCVQ